ncbi:hypothetical protein ADUPG1_011305 [Aduncisulcus paluster]|uniref:Uncharacterized protein n=1 Tax=Aduncisulcus paluster TaxID=2918883 RepID=A0ABQ5JV40_9EUKA|nr:hypothetical protein ADUPG1_011305 [Aduncisulcus paluster]|eukprot:gnl/Carplike_NY0171/7179_a9904_229.p1 GENE.gnl/Carplike_NY0171/7179_a9904_229~~gnl/Carplike_NY0171/7179_a9904_229.p1  ORF type:complete len:175 (+),score=32.10 gnl/Carplike_NY0171/7179_a9904_229:2-526(+)
MALLNDAFGSQFWFIFCLVTGYIPFGVVLPIILFVCLVRCGLKRVQYVDESSNRLFFKLPFTISLVFLAFFSFCNLIYSLTLYISLPIFIFFSILAIISTVGNVKSSKMYSHPRFKWNDKKRPLPNVHPKMVREGDEFHVDPSLPLLASAPSIAPHPLASYQVVEPHSDPLELP